MSYAYGKNRVLEMIINCNGVSFEELLRIITNNNILIDFGLCYNDITNMINELMKENKINGITFIINDNVTRLFLFPKNTKISFI